MSHPLEPGSRIGRVRAFYDANPDEELTIDDVAIKFCCTTHQAYKLVHVLHESHFLVSVGRRPTVYRKVLP